MSHPVFYPHKVSLNANKKKSFGDGPHQSSCRISQENERFLVFDLGIWTIWIQNISGDFWLITPLPLLFLHFHWAWTQNNVTRENANWYVQIVLWSKWSCNAATQGRESWAAGGRPSFIPLIEDAGPWPGWSLWVTNTMTEILSKFSPVSPKVRTDFSILPRICS